MTHDYINRDNKKKRMGLVRGGGGMARHIVVPGGTKTRGRKTWKKTLSLTSRTFFFSSKGEIEREREREVRKSDCTCNEWV